MANTREQIIKLFELPNQTELTAEDVWMKIDANVSKDTIRTHLKELYELGFIRREKVGQSYSYTLEVRPNDEAVAAAEEAGHAQTATLEPVFSIVFLVRKDNIKSHIWGSQQYEFARLLAPFCKSGRSFQKIGNTVVSVFATQTPHAHITRTLQERMPDLTFTIVDNLPEAHLAIQAYTPSQVDFNYFDSWVASYLRQVSRYLDLDLPEASSAVESVPTPTQTTVTDPMQIMAAGRAFTLSNEQMTAALALLATDYLRRNP